MASVRFFSMSSASSRRTWCPAQAGGDRALPDARGGSGPTAVAPARTHGPLRAEAGLAAHTPNRKAQSGRLAGGAERGAAGTPGSTMRPRHRDRSRSCRLPRPPRHILHCFAHVPKDVGIRARLGAGPRHHDQLDSLGKRLATHPVRFPNPPSSPVAARRSLDLTAHSEPRFAPPRGPAPKNQHRWPIDPDSLTEDGLELIGARQPLTPRQGLPAHHPRLR